MTREEKYQEILRRVLGFDGHPVFEDVLRALERSMEEDWQISLRTMVEGDQNGSRYIWYLQITHDEGGDGAPYEVKKSLIEQSERLFDFLLRVVKPRA